MKNWILRKVPDAWKNWRQEEKETTEDEMVGWHHWLDGPEFEQALGVGDEQGSLACCSPCGCKEFDMTEWLYCLTSHFLNFKNVKFPTIIYTFLYLKLLLLLLLSHFSHVWLCVTPWTAALQASLSITNSWSLLKLRSIESVMPSSHLCHSFEL